METRNIIAGILVFAITVALAIGASYFLFKEYPALIGMDGTKPFILKEDIPQKRNRKVYFSQDTMPIISTVEITRERLHKFERELTEKQVLKHKNDSLIKVSKALMDSIPSLFKALDKQLDTSKYVQKMLKRSSLNAEKLKDSIKKIKSSIQAKDAKIKSLEKAIADRDAAMGATNDSLKIIHYKNFAKIYNNSSSVEVAKILEKIDEKEAASIIRYMNKKKAGKVLDAMNPEASAAILMQGVVDLK